MSGWVGVSLGELNTYVDGSYEFLLATGGGYRNCWGVLFRLASLLGGHHVTRHTRSHSSPKPETIGDVAMGDVGPTWDSWRCQWVIQIVSVGHWADVWLLQPRERCC